MKDAEVVIEQELRNIYYDPAAGYRSAEKQYQKAKEKREQTNNKGMVKNSGHIHARETSRSSRNISFRKPS